MADLYFPKGKEAKRLARRHAKGEIHRIRKGIYIDTHDAAEIARTLENKWPRVAGYLFQDPIAVARTAVELRPANGRLYFVSDKLTGRRTVVVGHLRLGIEPGNGHLGVERFSLETRRSVPARYLLENLAPSRGNVDERKTLGPECVEDELIKIVDARGKEALNEIRDAARELAPPLQLEKEFEMLDKMISAILRTYPAKGILRTGAGIARAGGRPFDPRRVEIFRAFADYLTRLELSENGYVFNSAGWRNLSFFESYFSNYIEDTEFTIEEAEEIVFRKGAIYQRHQDSHDVLAHNELSSDLSEMNKVPATDEELIGILTARHKLLLSERPDKRPGLFKKKANKAGGTVFVLPEHLEGTLVEGFKIYHSLRAGINRALFIHFLVSECHPFDDGNGRLSRIMMNAELVHADQFKIIVPTVHRDSYLNGVSPSFSTQGVNSPESRINRSREDKGLHYTGGTDGCWRRS